MSKLTRMGIRLVALIPVLWLGGWVMAVLGVDAVAAAVIVFAVGAVWICVATWGALHAPLPARLTEGSRHRHLASHGGIGGRRTTP